METSLQTEADGDQVLPGAGIQSMHCDSASEPESRPRCSSRSRSPSPSRGGVGVSAWVHSDDDSVSHASMPAPGLEAPSHRHAWVHSDDDDDDTSSADSCADADTSSADSCADADAAAGQSQPQVAPPPAEVKPSQQPQVAPPPAEDNKHENNTTQMAQPSVYPSLASSLLGRLGGRTGGDRLQRPSFASRTFWGEWIWLALQSSTHPNALVQPPRRIGWELQCAGSAAELLGFKAFCCILGFVDKHVAGIGIRCLFSMLVIGFCKFVQTHFADKAS